MSEPRPDLTRITLSVAFIAGLAFTSLYTISPFIGAAVWATMLVTSTWPVLDRVQARLRGKRWAAVMVMTLAFALIFVVPATAAVVTLAANSDAVTGFASRIASTGLPPAPAWLAKIPMGGAKLTESWNDLASTGPTGLAHYLRPYASETVHWLLARLTDVGGAFVQFLLTLAIAAVMYAKGERGAAGVKAFATRLLGERGPSTVELAGKSVRSVALGVVLTAVLQTAAGGIGIVIAGVPYAAVITIVMFISCIAQTGATLVLIPCVIWGYVTQGAGWGTFLLIWTLVVGQMTNFVRPWLIKRGANISLLLILPGVIGGLLTFGILGIFVGPVLLAVTYTLLEAWVTRSEATTA